MEDALSPHGLSLPQFAVLMTVLEHDGLTQNEIGTRFTMPAYAISRAIDHLEALGLARRVPHPTSRRSHRIEATPAAQRIAPDLFSIVRRVNAELSAPLSKTERAQLADMLTKLRVGGA